jgi:hypothetical protein
MPGHLIGPAAKIAQVLSELLEGEAQHNHPAHLFACRLLFHNFIYGSRKSPEIDIQFFARRSWLWRCQCIGEAAEEIHGRIAQDEESGQECCGDRLR